MFKPHYGTCKGGHEGFIVVKAGYCQRCNHAIKEAKKSKSGRNADADRNALQSGVDEAGTEAYQGQDIEGYTRPIGYRISPKAKNKQRGKRTSPAEIREKVHFGSAQKGLQGITKEHTRVYYIAFDYTVADFVPCEICGLRAVDINHIDCRGMGGTDDPNYNRIENLMGTCRDDHNKYGDKKEFRDLLITRHFEFLSANGVLHDKLFFEKWHES